MTLRASKGQEASGSLCRTNDPKIRIRRDRLDGSNLEVRRQNVAQLSLRGSQCVAHTRSKMVSAQSLGHSACETKRATQSQGCGCPKTCRHSASDVDRWYRIQMVIKGDCQANSIARLSNSRRPPAGTKVPAGTLALVRSPQALRCSKEQTRFTH